MRSELERLCTLDLNEDISKYIKESGWVEDKHYKLALVNKEYIGFYLFISDERGASIPGKLYQITDLKMNEDEVYTEDSFIVPYGSNIMLLLHPAFMDTAAGVDLARFLLNKEREVIESILNPKQGTSIIAAKGIKDRIIIDPYLKSPG